MAWPAVGTETSRSRATSGSSPMLANSVVPMPKPPSASEVRLSHTGTERPRTPLRRGSAGWASRGEVVRLEGTRVPRPRGTRSIPRSAGRLGGGWDPTASGGELALLHQPHRGVVRIGDERHPQLGVAVPVDQVRPGDPPRAAAGDRRQGRLDV